MTEALTIWTYDWVPEGKSGPGGYVRDIRLRWACEEAGLDYEVSPSRSITAEQSTSRVSLLAKCLS
jgi:hypothetical protein